jgi:hypothetical protein
VAVVNKRPQKRVKVAPSNGAGRLPRKVIQSLADLSPDPHNANTGTSRGAQQVETSVRRYGFGRSILADKHGRVIAGNKTVEAARLTKGNPGVVVVETTGDQLVVVQRTDLDLDERPAQELGVADNRASEVGLEWNVAELQALDASGADVQQFFRPPEWAAMIEAAAAVLPPLPEMEIQPFEHYDYIMVVFRDSHAWTRACDRLRLTREGVTLGGRRKIGLGRVITGERFLAVLDTPTKPKTPKKPKASS